ncbi:hypothetical protein B9Z55_009234 [Caenorhabditis nigoni]|uniref:DUF7809 domain-containing protein n=1 Tax=Caenorhabditis nigoni TaxID=1611254 RepID=A0A2G5UR31_9PELO|nr:hypothetical protein B9Z55_009234 [Caenorhabditis nigoni]
MSEEGPRFPILLTKSALSRALVRYIPKELHKYVKLPFVGLEESKNEGQEDLEWMLANSDNMLRMYGSGEELAANLKIYMGYSSAKWIGYDSIEPYNCFITDYHSLNDESFILKFHMFIILQAALYLNVNVVKYADIYNAILSIHLKSIDTEMLEFVNRTDFDMIRGKLNNELVDNEFGMEPPENSPNFKLYSLLGKSDSLFLIIKEFKELIPVWKDEYNHLEALILNSLEENHPIDYEELNFVYDRLKLMMTYVEGVISSYPDIFLPYDRKKNPNHPIAVRVFKDDDHAFMMKSELFDAINLVNPNSKKHEDINGKLLTLACVTIFKEYLDQTKRIEFLLVPIERTKHATVPIRTPSGDYCILAADALFETLNRLIFCHRIFQKFQKITWPILSAHLAQLAEFFSANEKSPFFVTMEKVKSIEESIINSLKNYEKIPANSVRNAKKDGFTVQNLKNELANLGLTSLFPEVQDYAEAVYSEVFKSKKQEFLRTCDLFDAVEKCLLICIFKRFPNLQLFVHTQNACHRLPNLHCNHCSGVSQSKKFQGTTWKDFGYDGNSYSYLLPPIEAMILPDGRNTSVQPNFSQLRPKISQECRYFLLDKDDHCELTCLEATDEFFEKTVANLDTFQKFYPKKKIYIRAIPTGKEGRDESRRVFAEEVLDLIPVVLRQQSTPLKKNDERLNNYRNIWKMPKYSVKTISLATFWNILEEFDVDKTRITIVPDPNYENTAYQVMKSFENRFFKIRSPHGNWVVRKEYAAFKIFESVICQLDRSTEQLPEHLNYLDRMRQDVISSTLQFLQHNEGAYIDLRKVEITISIFQNHYMFKEYSNECSPLKSFKMMGVNGLVPIDGFLTYLGKRKFHGYLRENTEMMRKTEFVSVWKCYEWYLNACLQEFQGLEEDNLDIVKVIREEISFRIPPDERFLEKMKPKEYPMESFLSCEGELNEEDDVDRKKKKKKTPKKKAEVKVAPESPDIQKTLVSEEANEEVLEEAPEVETQTSDDIQKTNPIEKQTPVDINQSKCCTKCLRTSEMCNEARKELKMTQNRLEKYEKKAKRTEEVVIQMREMEVEMKKMKKEMKEKEVEMNRKDTENEDLRRNLLKSEAKNAKMQLGEKNHSISQHELLEKITNLSDQLKNEKERNELMELQLQQSEENLKSEAREKERGFEELRAVEYYVKRYGIDSKGQSESTRTNSNDSRSSAHSNISRISFRRTTKPS